MSVEDKREQRLKLLEDDIGRSLTESQRNGELKSAPSYGKALDLGDGYFETPDELRMGFKVLKDAGVLPPEVALMRQIEALRQSLAGLPQGADAAHRGLQRLSELQQQLTLRLERLRATDSL